MDFHTFWFGCLLLSEQYLEMELQWPFVLDVGSLGFIFLYNYTNCSSQVEQLSWDPYLSVNNKTRWMVKGAECPVWVMLNMVCWVNTHTLTYTCVCAYTHKIFQKHDYPGCFV